MEKLTITVLFALILHTFALHSAEVNDDIFTGKIDFVSTARCEVIVNVSPDSPFAVTSGGSVLYASAGKKRVLLTVIKADGKLLRCSFKCSDKTGLIPAEGAEVFYSMKDNAASAYSDVKMLLSGLIKLYEDFIVKIESTDDPVRIAAAVDGFSASMDRIIPEMDRLNKRYPELKDFMTSPPQELKSAVLLIKELEPGLNDAFFKVKMFASHPDVQKALQRLQSVLDRMNTGRD